MVYRSDVKCLYFILEKFSWISSEYYRSETLEKYASSMISASWNSHVMIAYLKLLVANWKTNAANIFFPIALVSKNFLEREWLITLAFLFQSHPHFKRSQMHFLFTYGSLSCSRNGYVTIYYGLIVLTVWNKVTLVGGAQN